MQQHGTIYLLHFKEPYRHARHYMGWSRYVDKRIEHHVNGTGARLPGVVAALGIELVLARTWQGTRDDERRLKRQKNGPRLCPICREAA